MVSTTRRRAGRGRRLWKPPSLGRRPRAAELAYLVVDDIFGDGVSLVLSDWPELDGRGRLRFADPPLSLGADRDRFERYLAEHRRPHAHADRPLRIGDVFGVRVNSETLAQVADKLAAERRLEPLLAPESWIRPPVYDVTADARDAAKGAFYAAVAPTLTSEQAAHLRDAEPRAVERWSPRPWLRSHVTSIFATAVVAVAGLGTGLVLTSGGNGEETTTLPGSVTTVTTTTRPPPPSAAAAPAVVIESGPGISARPIAIFRYGSNSAITYRCALDHGPFSGCGTSYTTPRLGPGSHVFEVRARDANGNLGEITAYPWTIAAPPGVTLTQFPTATTALTEATFAFTSKGRASGFECKLDDRAFVECTSPHRTGTATAGYHTFVVRALESGFSGRPALSSWQVVDVDLTVEIDSFGFQNVAFNVTNSGAAEIMTSFKILIEFGPPAQQRTINVLRIGPGATQTFTEPTPDNLDCSNVCDVRVTVDSGSAVSELDEENNVASDRIVG
jgi:hypothetical protein